MGRPSSDLTPSTPREAEVRSQIVYPPDVREAVIAAGTTYPVAVCLSEDSSHQVTDRLSCETS